MDAQCIISTTEAKFSRHRTIMRKFLTNGVTRKGTRGIPPCVAQEEFGSKKAHIDIRVKEKELVLEKDPKCTNLVEAIMYDTKPVHYIRMVSEELKWVVKEKRHFGVDTGKVKN